MSHKELGKLGIRSSRDRKSDRIVLKRKISSCCSRGSAQLRRLKSASTQ